MDKKNTLDIVFELNKDQLKLLINKIEDLTDINEKILLKFDPENLLIYTFDGIEKDIHAFKSYIFSNKEFFSDINPVENIIKFILLDGKKITKTLDIFQTFDENITFKLIYNEDGYGEKLMVKNSKLKLDIIGGLSNTFKQDISLEQIKDIMDPTKSNFYIKLLESDFVKIKKMSSIEKDNDIYYLKIKDKQVFLGETRWNLLIGETDYINDQIKFPKKYFNTINFDEDSITLYIFETFLLVLGKESNLMITVEL